MKILFLSPTVPFPLTDGGRIRVFNLLKQIAEKSDVTLLALETQPTNADGVAQLQQFGIQVHLVPNAPTLPRVSFSTLVNAFLKRTTHYRCTLRAACLSSEIQGVGRD